MECKEPIKLFISPRTGKVLPWQYLLPGIIEKKANQLQSMQGFGMQRTPQKFLSPRNIKSVAKALHVTDYCQKANQPQLPLQ